MNNKNSSYYLFLTVSKTALLLFALMSPGAFAREASGQDGLWLPRLLSDHMVLQSGRPAALWGRAAPRSPVSVTFLPDKGGPEVSLKTVADDNGRWSGRLPALNAGTRGVLHIMGDGNERVIQDVLAGEVWLGAGQSNMGFSMGAANVPKEIQEAEKRYADREFPAIRLFNVAREGEDAPRDDVNGEWVVISSENARHFPAVAWYFAQTLHEELNRPVGMIVSSIGGTPIESWLPADTIAETSMAKAIHARHLKALQGWETRMPDYENKLASWKEKYPTVQLQHKHNASKPREPYNPKDKGAPSHLYNAMLHGLAPYTISGIIWYQGENNSARPGEYAELVRAFISRLRKNWGEELPFYYVEIANFKAPQREPVEGGFAFIREAQAGALLLPKTGVATAVDLGLADEAHYPNKKPLGQRLAGMALADVYHVTSGDSRSPELAGFKIEGNSVRLRFKHAGGLRLRGDSLKGFAIRGDAGAWMWAEGRIEGGEIVVWNKAIPSPVAVRYGWADNPVLSIENSRGLPLRPFRTDSDGKK
jgi:sialate O-acetylesterase